MKKQSDIAKKYYQGLEKVDRLDKGYDEVMKKTGLKKYKQLDLLYKNKFKKNKWFLQIL